MDFLVRAGEQGYSVPVNAINKGNERLLRYLQEPGLMTVRCSDDAQASRCRQAYAALVLARQQKARSAHCVKSGAVTTRRDPACRCCSSALR